MKEPMRILLLSSEVAPFAKTGGLADVSAALARFLVQAGHDVRLVMPMYGRVRKGGWGFEPYPSLQDVPLELGPHRYQFSVSTARPSGSEARVWFVRCPELYGADEIYGSGEDEHVRFAFLGRAALAACQHDRWSPDVVHCNDWHTGLVPLYLKVRLAWDALFENTKSVLTIHNLGYQGVFSAEALADLDLDGEQHLLDQDDLESGYFSFLKTGIVYADALTTVSETYAREIQTPELGMGLQDVLRARSDALHGIVNGIDTDEWDPATDRYLPHHFTADDLAGKAACKLDLLRQFELDADGRAPLLAIVSRLTAQKGFELLPDVLPVVLQRRDVRLIVLGSGEKKYESYFQWLRDAYPRKVGVYHGYSEELAHRIEAGSDLFLMPSRYEPCGLNQMYSLRYGTVPIVRATGGLSDTVQPFDRASGEGTGFSFVEFQARALLDTVWKALDTYEDPDAWRLLVTSGMARDHSWSRQGRRYARLYEELAGR